MKYSKNKFHLHLLTPKNFISNNSWPSFRKALVACCFIGMFLSTTSSSPSASSFIILPPLIKFSLFPCASFFRTSPSLSFPLLFPCPPRSSFILLVKTDSLCISLLCLQCGSALEHFCISGVLPFRFQYLPSSFPPLLFQSCYSSQI